MSQSGHMKKIHFLNGKFIEEKDLKVSARDLGFSRGFAVFAFFITYNGKPFMSWQQVDRLFKSASLINLKIPYSKGQMHDWALQTLAKNNDGTEKAVRIIVSGGVSDSVFSERKDPTLIIQIDERPYLPKDCYENGINAMTVRYLRYTPGAKTNHYIEAAKHRDAVKANSAIEIIYYNDDGVTEGCVSNVFAVIGGKLVTPKSNILPGITRAILLEHMDIEERNFTIEELRKATEVFVTSSNKEVLPVTRIDGIPVGNGSVGAITKEAMFQFKQFRDQSTSPSYPFAESPFMTLIAS